MTHHIDLEEQKEQIKMINSCDFERLRSVISTGKISLNQPYISPNPTINSRTPLHLIVSHGENNKLLEWILINLLQKDDAGVKADINILSKTDLNVKTETGFTPLAVAASFKNIKAMKLLIAYGADPTIRDNILKKTPLEILDGRISDKSQLELIEQVIKDQKEGKLPSPKPIFLTEQEAGLAPLAKENQSENASSNVLNALRSKLRETVAFWKHAANKPTEEKAKLLKKEKEEEKEKTN